MTLRARTTGTATLVAWHGLHRFRASRRSPAARSVCEGLARRNGERTLDALVECARSGDPKAFRQVTERLAPQLVRYVVGYLRGDVHTANDIVQDTFVSAWHKLAEIEDGEHLRPWLFKVARFKAISYLRRRGPGGTPMESIDFAADLGFDLPEPSSRSPLRRAMRTDRPDPWVSALRDGVTRLPRIYLGVVRLHYMHGFTVKETADLLGIESAAVKMRLLRARRVLKALVIEELEARRAQ